MTKDEFEVFKCVLDRNKYFAHQEFILYSALFDENIKRRNIAIDWIRKDRLKRSKNSENLTVRKFEVPELRWNAASYFELVDFKSIPMTEPPLTFSLTKEQLLALLKGTDLESTNIPCHSQANERAVATTAIVTGKYETETKQTGNIIQKGQSRSLYGTDVRKQDFSL